MSTNKSSGNRGRTIIRIIVKVILLLTIINFGWALIPDSVPAQINIYNWLVDGRVRFPFGENPERAYNLSLFNLDSMFASHEVDKLENDAELRIFLIGDSSIWGFLQKPEQTLAGLLTQQHKANDIEVYNLGYPSISILKDALIIDYALQYEPDLIIWFTTLEALPTEKQLPTPIVANNTNKLKDIIGKYSLSNINPQQPSFLQRTFWAQRRNIFDIIRLQFYGILWEATGIDQDYPDSYREAQRDFPEPKLDYYGITASRELSKILSMEVIESVIEKNSEVDFIVVNEPILISEGENAHLKYNFYYPRWAYDTYREIINTFTTENGIKYYDLWNIVPEAEFTNSAIHLTVTGEQMLANMINEIILEYLGESTRSNEE